MEEDFEELVAHLAAMDLRVAHRANFYDRKVLAFMTNCAVILENSYLENQDTSRKTVLMLEEALLK